MEVRSLRWWSAAQQVELAKSLESSWSNWQKNWLAGSDKLDTSCDVRCQLVHELAINSDANWIEKDQRGWQPLYDGQTILATQILMRDSESFKVALQTWLFNPLIPRIGIATDEMKNASLAMDLTEKAWNDWLAELRIFLKIAQPASSVVDPNNQSSSTNLPTSHYKAWSGAVRMTLTYRSVSLELQISADQVAKIIGAQRSYAQKPGAGIMPITPLNQALNSQRISIRAQLASLELDLGSLQSLAIGNVIPLPHNLDQPLTVISDTDVVLCTAHLVQHQGVRALELFRTTESNLY